MHESMKTLRRRGARIARASLAVLGAYAVLAAVTPPAAAVATLPLVSIECVGTMRLDYSPGLTNDPRTVTLTIRRTLDLCTSLLDPQAITSGEVETTQLTAERSCTDLSAPALGRTVTVEWSNATTSTFAYDAHSTYVNGELLATHNGQVASGTLNGHTMHADLVLLADNPSGCSAPEGVQRLEGSMLLHILPI
jgi:hypothetical protein